MKKKTRSSDASGSLRRRAEKQLEGQSRDPNQGSVRLLSEEDPARQLHELQVHQIELEMQNAELEEGRERMEALVEKYTDLYEFAPVGYFSIDEEGRILQVNLTGAALLGWDRAALSKRLLLDLVAPASRAVFRQFLGEVFSGSGRKACEAALMRLDGSTLWADLQSAAAVTDDTPRWCRVAVSDISALKRADELTRINAELEKEIERRLEVEVSLRRSEAKLNRLLAQSHQMEEQLRRLSHRLLGVQEEERNRISRELHDDIAQILIGVQVHLQSLMEEKPSSLSDFRKRFARTQELVGESVERVQKFARDLRPAMLDDLGLVAALRAHLRAFSEETKISVDFKAPADIEPLGIGERTTLFRVAQSALTNVANHARATRVRVRIGQVRNSVYLEIHDNGSSFEVEKVSSADGRKRLGLLGMQERLKMIGGHLCITSAVGKGTTVRAELPLDPASPSGATRE